MRRNRATNGAAQPEAVASSEAADQRSELVLSTQGDEDFTPQSRTFPAQLSTIPQIMADRRRGIDNPDGFGKYDAHLPYGPRMGEQSNGDSI